MMMKKIILSIIGLIFIISATSQDKIVILHPIVGDTITLKEKTDYLLFPNVVDSVFNYGLLHLKNNTYQLHIYHSTDSLIVQIDSSDIYQYKQNIEKLAAYYSNDALDDRIESSESIMLNNNNTKNNSLNQSSISPTTLKRTLKEAERTQLLNNSADKQGLNGKERENYINTGGAGSIKLRKKK
jgi:hypothetical protein